MVSGRTNPVSSLRRRPISHLATSARLFQNIAQLEKELEQRGEEILRLQAASADGLNPSARARLRASA
jgi:hypothetical protein